MTDHETKNERALSILAIAFLVLLCCCMAFVARRQDVQVNFVPQMAIKPNNVYDETIVVVADMDYSPYSYLDENGAPCGHDVELLYELANRMGVNTDLRLMPWRDAITAVQTGEADLILAFASSLTDDPLLATSIPLVTDSFVAFGAKPISRVGDLYGKRLAVLDGTGVVSDFLVPYRLMDRTTLYPTNSAAFDAFAHGECDYVIARYSVGRRSVAQMSAEVEIAAVGPTLLNGYMCMATGKQNAALLDRLDSAIISAAQDGTLEALSVKWLGSYVQTLTVTEFLSQNWEILSLGVLGLLFLALVAYLIIRTNRARYIQQALRREAEHDPLTGLYNRTASEMRIQTALRQNDAPDEKHALFIIDIDNFKLINDTFGHMQGDTLLKDLANGLTQLFRATDVVSRLGGDEFFVFLRNYQSLEIVEQKARQICELFHSTCVNGDKAQPISASIGIALFPEAGVTFPELYRNADMALYQAKASGKNGYVIYRATDAQFVPMRQSGGVGAPSGVTTR